VWRDTLPVLEIPADIPNVRDVVFEQLLSMKVRERKGKEGTDVIACDMATKQSVWLIYNLAGEATKEILDLLMVQLCKKSLKELLEPTMPDEPLPEAPFRNLDEPAKV
jgi:hypothetical protein